MTNTDKNNFNATIGNTVLCDGFLIPMTDFVVKESKTEIKRNELWETQQLKSLKRITNYAKFLKQQLKLEMFVPCDEDENVLGEPEIYSQWVREKFNDELENEERINQCKDYHQAKEKVLFEGFEFVSRTDQTWLFKINGNFPRIVSQKGTVELLRIFKDQIKLSQTALDSIFGKTVA